MRREMNMERTPVQSGHLVSVGYGQSSRTLEVEFKDGSVYHYFKVPPEVYEGLMKASSKGKYLANRVKDIYPYKKVG